ncbi:helix-turn-helix transcriptional regulator [Dyella flava]|uniref:Helix-turn-helix transcriptional regulator n=1 Tax=Dyella flava TaxID=1920170 RepID=A0ABS2JYL9_9GAMM|nr:AraC family transcriptional regulator [Dyella flava]MBM7123976.1 helix-turn-helix transcriptional regulator [Dyella flava]GLQ50578.1 transcriptional regulator [Dyella flava]
MKLEEARMYHGAFGDRLGRSFHLSSPPVLHSQTRRGVHLAVTELRIDQPGYGMTSPMGSDDAYLVCLNLRKQSTHELWCDGRSVCSTAYDAGTAYVLDLRCDPITYIGEPLHSLYFYMPRQAIVEASEELGKRNIAGLDIRPGECFQDAIVGHIAQTLLPIFNSATAANQPLINHLLQGLCAYMTSTYSGSSIRPDIVRGALAPWQQRLVMQMMRERIFDGISIGELAEACSLSAGALARGFKKSTGMSPHQWLLSRRVDLALELMADPDTTLAEIAFHAGFSDQSHFSRVFTQKMGVAPGAWRKSLANHKRMEAA